MLVDKLIDLGYPLVLRLLVLNQTILDWLLSELKSVFALSHGYQLSPNTVLTERPLEESRACSI
jgi:hypothetical protein